MPPAAALARQASDSAAAGKAGAARAAAGAAGIAAARERMVVYKNAPVQEVNDEAIVQEMNEEENTGCLKLVPAEKDAKVAVRVLVKADVEVVVKVLVKVVVKVLVKVQRCFCRPSPKENQDVKQEELLLKKRTQTLNYKFHKFK